MLAGLRSAAKHKLAIPIIALLAISFAVWGVSDAFRGGARDAVATVGPEKVTVTDFSRQFQSQVRALTAQSGEPITTQQARQAGLDQQILNQMVMGAALDAKAKQMGLGASDEQISRDLAQTEAFQDTVRGEFSRDIYEGALASASLTQKEYETTIGIDIRRQQLVSGLVGAVRAPAMLVNTRQAYRNESRTAEVLVLPAALAEPDGEPDEAQLAETLAENQQLFTFPERRVLSVLWMDIESMQDGLEVSEDDVRALYEFRGDSLNTPATRSFIQISAADEAAAEAAAERLRAGEPADAVAQALDLPAPITQDAAVREDVVDGVLAERIFGEGVEPRVFVAEGALGWAAIQVTGGEEGQAASFEGVADQLRQELAEESAVDALYDAVADYEDALGEGLGLEEAAKAVGLPTHSYAPLSPRGQTQSGAIYIDLLEAPELLAEAFVLNIGQVSDLIETPDGGYAVVRVDRIEPQRTAELDEAREDVATLWRAQRRDEMLQEIQADARARLEAGESFAEVAESLGPPARNELSIFKRGETSGAVGPQLGAALFEAVEGELVSGQAAGGGRALARVTDIAVEGDPAPQMQTEMAVELQNDLLLQFQTALTGEYEVRMYPDQVDLALGDTEQ